LTKDIIIGDLMNHIGESCQMHTGRLSTHQYIIFLLDTSSIYSDKN